jgi:hypothetical protein
MGLQRLTYPSHITKPGFEKRRVEITIFKPGQNTVTQSLELARTAISKANGLISIGDDPTVAEAMRNIEANKESKQINAELMGTITLPLPNVFQDSQNHGWAYETGVMGQIGENITNLDVGEGLAAYSEKKRQAGLAMAAGGGTFVKGAGLVTQAAGAAGGFIGKKMAGVSINKALGNIASATGTRKPLIDPSYFQNYSGSAPRTFSMLFEFAPKNLEEAQNAVNIIMSLKRYASPSRTSGVSLLAPYFFNIKLSNDIISGMAKFDRCVISDIAVDYGADGAMQQFHDGTPKYMTLQLSFQEADMTTADDYTSIPQIKG